MIPSPQTRRSLMAALAGLSLAVVPSVALAQSVQEQAHDVILASMAETGFPMDQQIAMTECFSARLTEAEAEALIAADGLDAQQEVVSAMEDHDAALVCVVAVLE